jgi:hypothetical protein
MLVETFSFKGFHELKKKKKKKIMGMYSDLDFFKPKISWQLRKSVPKTMDVISVIIIENSAPSND